MNDPVSTRDATIEELVRKVDDLGRRLSSVEAILGTRSAAAAEEAGVKIGAALGFVGFAEDGEELADAVASAGRGCGICHAAAEVPTDVPRPPWLHETAAAWAVHGLVWGAEVAPPTGGEGLIGLLAEEWSEPVPTDTGPAPAEGEARVARLIAACASCHQGYERPPVPSQAPPPSREPSEAPAPPAP